MLSVSASKQSIKIRWSVINQIVHEIHIRGDVSDTMYILTDIFLFAFNICLQIRGIQYCWVYPRMRSGSYDYMFIIYNLHPAWLDPISRPKVKEHKHLD